MKNLSSENIVKHLEPLEELMNLKFQERFDVSDDLHQRILQSNFQKKQKINTVWFVAAGIAALVFINIFSIRNYNQHLVKEELKEVYSTDWNNDLNLQQ